MRGRWKLAENLPFATHPSETQRANLCPLTYSTYSLTSHCIIDCGWGSAGREGDPDGVRRGLVTDRRAGKWEGWVGWGIEAGLEL